MLLVDSAAVASMLERDTGKKVFVLADTSYGRYKDVTVLNSVCRFQRG